MRGRVAPRGRIIVLGIMGRIPFAGVAWQALHYLEGFRRLGFEVYYVDDTEDWPYDVERETITDDEGFPLAYLGRLMTWCGLGDRWAYRNVAKNALFGPAADRIPALLREADVLVNVTGATVLRDEHRGIAVRIYLETDPVMPQILVAKGDPYTIDVLGAHTHHFTFGENIGGGDCGVPTDGPFTYRATRQPVVLDWWTPSASPSEGATAAFTTVASWQQSGKDIEWQGERYLWSKHHEFLRFLDLPRRRRERFELALACGDADALQLLSAHGWQVRDAIALSRDILPYRDYIRGSRGEFTVAKDQNIRLRSGWFSDRSACYLAAGHPVVTQGTGFSKTLPTGKGLFEFSTMDDILAAMDELASDYEGHCRAATELAADHFASDVVLSRLLADAGL